MTTVKQKTPFTIPELKQYAMGLLAGREYGARELLQKLNARSDSESAEEVLVWLQSQQLQSDDRYARMLLQSKAGRGQGPLRIRQDMKHRGLSGDAIEAAFAEFGGDWFALALSAYEKKFRQPVTSDPRERARRQRFLAYRGYTGDQIAHALEQGHQECTNHP